MWKRPVWCHQNSLTLRCINIFLSSREELRLFKEVCDLNLLIPNIEMIFITLSWALISKPNVLHRWPKGPAPRLLPHYRVLNINVPLRLHSRILWHSNHSGFDSGEFWWRFLGFRTQKVSTLLLPSLSWTNEFCLLNIFHKMYVTIVALTTNNKIKLKMNEIRI